MLNRIISSLILTPFFAVCVSSYLYSQDLDTIWVHVDDSSYFTYHKAHGFINKSKLKTNLSDGHYIVYDNETTKRFLRKDIKFKQVLVQVDIIDEKYEGNYVKYTPDGKTLTITSYKNGLKHGYETTYRLGGPFLLFGNRKLYENGELIRQLNRDTTIKE